MHEGVQQPRYFRSYRKGPDGKIVDGGGIYRRQSETVSGDAVFRRDLKLHFTTAIQLSLKGYNDVNLRKISEVEAAQHGRSFRGREFDSRSRCRWIEREHPRETKLNAQSTREA